MSALVYVIFALYCLLTVDGLRCYQCGQYTDGVGSITPCLNYTARHLKDCPPELSQNCIKYVTEGSIVRECAGHCVEKRESWGTKMFCCSEDGCNSASRMAAGAALLAALFLRLF
ncbi:U-scoloptoxin(05)-Sm1a [Halyomorpha halys]|uniref:U-scoloptoxin(05)-Sm1a n=1 Tax=Halyomorpha halys TaxID=286706 RepID=UPI0006D5008C